MTLLAIGGTLGPGSSNLAVLRRGGRAWAGHDNELYRKMEKVDTNTHGLVRRRYHRLELGRRPGILRASAISHGHGLADRL